MIRMRTRLAQCIGGPGTLVTAAAVLWFGVAVSAQWGSGWTIPPDAPKEMSPVKPDADVLAAGKTIFDGNCARCHGPKGMGDGPDSDPRNPAADLSDPYRADLNPDGVMYYRVLNGKPPYMPAFKDELSSDEVWTVVEFAKSLRAPQ